MTKVVLGVLGLAGLASAASAQLVVAFDDTAAGVTTAYEIRVSDGSNVATPLFSGVDVWGIADDDASGTLWVNSGSELYKWSYGDFGIAPTKVADLKLSGATSTFVGLAFNGGKLYGIRNTGTEGIFEINTATGDAVLVSSYLSADYDLGGLDFDDTSGVLYATNDDTSPFGTGLFKVDHSGAVASLTKLAFYPAGESDIDGLAVGGGRAYLIEDEAGPSIHVYNLSSGLYEAPLTSPFATSEVFSAGTWADGLVPAPGTFALLGLGGLIVARRRR